MARNTVVVLSWLTAITAILFANVAAAQTNVPAVEWQAGFGGIGADSLFNLHPTSDGGYILSGLSNSGVSGNKTNPTFGEVDYWVVKVDGQGNKQWESNLGGDDTDTPYTIQQTSDGGYIVGGRSQSGVSGNKTTPNFGAHDYWLVKLDGNGIKQWEKDYGGDEDDILKSVQQTGDGGYILGGYSESGISGNKTNANYGFEDYWVLKLDNSGNQEWEKGFGGTGSDQLYIAQQTSDGGYILGGNSISGVTGNKTASNFGGYDCWLIKVDGSGNKQWERVFGGNHQEFLYAMRQTSDGGYMLGSTSASGVSGNKTTANFGSFGSSDYWLVKVDGVGNKQWERAFGGSVNDNLTDLQQTSDGNYLLTGYSASGVSGNKTSSSFGSGTFDGWVIKVDVTGTKQWELSLGGTNQDVFYAGYETSEGGYILGAYSNSDISGNKTNQTFGSNDYWLVKLTSSPPTISALPLTNGNFTLRVSGLSSNRSTIVYRATDLPNWTPIFTNPPVNGSFDFVDLLATNLPQRFYRAALLP